MDPRSGFCKDTSIFHSKRSPIPSPPNHSLDITTFISAQSHHGKIAYIDAVTGHQLTFIELWHAVHAVSSYLSSIIGIKKGDIILILSPSSIFFPIVVLSVLSVGAVITTANPLNTAQELSKLLKDTKPALAFTTAQQVPKLSGSTFPIVLIDNPTRNVDQESRIVTTLAYMIAKKPSGKQEKEQITRDDPATMLYSSGTTGAPKGVVSSHGSLIVAIQSRRNQFYDQFPRVEDIKYLSTLPMSHVYGLHIFTMASVAIGATVVVLSQFELNQMLLTIEKYKITHIPLVPPVLVTMVKNADQIKSKYELKSLKWILCGGAPTSREVIDGFVEKYPNVVINQGYASTETNGAGTWTDGLEECKRYGTAGKLSPSTEAKIVDPLSGKALGVNQRGELWLRSPLVMKGYFNNPEATLEVLDSEGWLKTGDLCYIDDDGFLFVVDRLKELIKYKAYQVAPAELEALLFPHPEIADAAVIPFPDKDVGQFPMAYVVRKAGSNISEKAIMDYVAKQVASYKKIRRVAFVSAIPKNPSGKILRKDLINLATSNL